MPDATSRFKSLLLAFVVLLSSAGCTRTNMRYSLERWHNTPVLFPPHSSPIRENEGPFVVSLENARQKSALSGCVLTSPLITIRWHKNTAEIELRAESFVDQAEESAGPRPQAPRISIDAISAISDFQAQLLQLEARGCLRNLELQRIRRSISEAFPLPPVIAYRFELGSFDSTNYFELTPDFRLQVVSPIYDQSGSETLDHQTGYEVSDYQFKRRDPDGRISPALVSVGDSELGQPIEAKSRPRNPVDFPAAPSFYRLLLKHEKTSSRQVTHAFLLSSSEHANLHVSTDRILASATYKCAAPLPPLTNCYEFPQNFGVTPELRVSANGKDRFVALDGVVLEALQLPFDAEVPKTLHITRLYRQHRIPVVFDPATKDILMLTLLPGDELSW